MKPTIEFKPASRWYSRLEAMRSKPSGTLPGRNSRLILAIGVALCTSSAGAQAQGWYTVDDIPTLPGASVYAASVQAANSDSAGNLFVAGYMTEPGIGDRGPGDLARGVVMKSSDGGRTWDSDPSTPDVDEPSDATTPAADYSLATFTAIASARTTSGEEHIVSVEKRRFRDPYPWPSTYPNGYKGLWTVRRSLDAGATWMTLDQYTHPTYNMLPTFTGPYGASVGTNGNIYVAGSAYEYELNTTVLKSVHWLIRRGTAAGGGALQWNTIDFSYPTGSGSNSVNTYPSGVACAGNKVFVVGGSGPNWQVRRSNDSGATWTVADSYSYSSSDVSHATAIATDSAGNVFVAGFGNKLSKGVVTSYWIVRKGKPDGTGWVTVDQFLYANGNAAAAAVTVDSSNNVHVTGWGAPVSTLKKRWITRQRSAATGLWSTTEDFSLDTTRDAYGLAITADPFGNVFSAGRATDSGAAPHGWLVRRKLAP